MNEWNNPERTRSLIHMVVVAFAALGVTPALDICDKWLQMVAYIFFTLSFSWHTFPWDFPPHHWNVGEVNIGWSFKGKGTLQSHLDCLTAFFSQA